jgi:hyperosmotically inducible protein
VNRTILAALMAMMLVSACGEGDKGKTPGQKLDSALGRAQEEGAKARASAERGLSEAKVATEKAVKQAADATREPRAKAGEALADGAITTKIKAELARDAELSALQVGVETDKRRVTLTGSAPNAASKDRAATLAKAVDGVTSVDNKLVVAPR